MSDPTIPETTTALVLPAVNEPLNLEKTPTIKAAPAGSVLVHVLGTSVRPHNRAGSSGKSPLPLPVPYNPGDSGVGRVLAVGPDAVAVRPGQLVYLNGFYLARDDPEGTRVLAGLHNGFGDPGRAKLFGQLGGLGAAGLRAGETVVVAPATGYFSSAVAEIAEIAAQIGCRVVALSRSASKLGPLAGRHPRIAATASPHHLAVSLASLPPFGRAVFLGMIFDVRVNYMSLMARNITVKGQHIFIR
ncbi:hypothetical protein LX32DRAFT_658901 [Colletotrichum zoysiae]|uniref:Uncharacterized protein n=1 Tax=Colletotrichum zoysiae TaxID=1216348 RepID=A0AAD9H271_9PEZI|nr:hypothetical protein LX32DRAFT_658901 [Colletotrichum zoysiae]